MRMLLHCPVCWQPKTIGALIVCSGEEEEEEEDDDDEQQSAEEDESGAANERGICQPRCLPAAGFALLNMPSPGDACGSLSGKWDCTQVTVSGQEACTHTDLLDNRCKVANQ